MKTVFLITCVKSKQAQKAPAKEMYTSALFKGYLNYIESVKEKVPQPYEAYILSAKHGLLELDQEIEPYDETLLKMSTVEVKYWAEVKVLPRLRKKADLKEDLFIFLCGKRYREFVLPEVRYWHVPFAKLGIGKQLQRLKTYSLSGVNI